MSGKSRKVFCSRFFILNVRGGPRTVATSKMERFVIIVNGFKSSTIITITKCSILDVAAVLDPSICHLKRKKTQDDSWFYCKQVQEMHLRTLPETVVYPGHVDKREVLPRHRYKETRILLIYTVTFS